MTTYFEDIRESDIFRGDEVIVDKAEMLADARRNDPQPFHVDEELAKHFPYGGLTASAGYTVTLWYRSSRPIIAPFVFLGRFDWHIKMPNPVRAGDRLRLEIEICSKRPSNKQSDRGYVTTSQRFLNQDGKPVFICEVVWIIAARDSSLAQLVEKLTVRATASEELPESS
jgi:acyl dehydratase